MKKNVIMSFEGKKVEVFEFKGKVLFNSKHVAEILGIKNVRDNISRMNHKQVIKLTNVVVGKTDIRKLNNAGENFLTESGVYKLIMRSNKLEAERFQDWVTDEVLPSIRENGGYISTNATQEQVERLNREWARQSKYLTDEIHDRKSVRSLIRGSNLMELEETVQKIIDVVAPAKGNIKNEIIDAAIKELKRIDAEHMMDSAKNTYIKTVAKDSVVILQDVKIGKYKRRINTLLGQAIN